jgi:hypothetical protein
MVWRAFAMLGLVMMILVFGSQYQPFCVTFDGG